MTDWLVSRCTMMANDTITLALNGDQIGLEDFAKGVNAMSSMLKALRADVASESEVHWYVESLSTGSTIVTARCVGKRGAVNRLVKSCEKAGQAFREERRTGFSPSVDREFKKLAALINGNIHSVRLETQNTDIEIDKLNGGVPDEDASEVASISAVQGRIETIGRHHGLRFTLYEIHSDCSISCYLTPGFEEIMREAWGRIAIVQGLARRDPRSGRITCLRGVSEVEIIPEVTPEECLDVIGAYESLLDEPPEMTLDRLRNNE